jgi:hypothetical protein
MKSVCMLFVSFHTMAVKSYVLRLMFWGFPQRVVFNSRRFGTLCLFHLHRRVDMKLVKLESLVVEAGTERPSPSWGVGVCLQVDVRWWLLMTSDGDRLLTFWHRNLAFKF